MILFWIDIFAIITLKIFKLFFDEVRDKEKKQKGTEKKKGSENAVIKQMQTVSHLAANWKGIAKLHPVVELFTLIWK